MLRDFIAIDFETANQEPSSVCSIGVVMVRDGQIVDSFYSLIQPEPNYYNYWCQRVHGIMESDTEDAPVFSKVWQQLEEHIVEVFFSNQELDDIRYQIAAIPFVAHNARFDEGCLKAVFKVYQMDYLRRAAYCPGVFHRRTGTDDYHHRYTIWHTEHETGYAGYLAVRHESEVETITARMSEHIYECAMVLRGWYLDMAHTHLLRSHFLHYHHWHSFRKDALPTGKVGPVTIR